MSNSVRNIRLTIVFALVSTLAVPAAAGVLEGTMARGNQLYEDGDYQGAVAQYEKVLDYGLRNAAVHYNLGNAWYKLGRPGRAILHYERALRLDPGDDDARRNLAYVRGRTIDRVADGGENIYLRLLHRFRDALTLDQAAFAFLGAWLLLSAAVFLRIIGNGALRGTARGRTIFYTALFALLVMAASGLQYGLHWRQVTDDSTAIVTAEKVDVTSAPSGDAKLVTPVHEGLKVRVIEAREGWLRIVIPGVGLGGWVPDDQLERI